MIGLEIKCAQAQSYLDLLQFKRHHRCPAILAIKLASSMLLEWLELDICGREQGDIPPSPGDIPGCSPSLLEIKDGP